MNLSSQFVRFAFGRSSATQCQSIRTRKELVTHASPEFQQLATRTSILVGIYPFLALNSLPVEVGWSCCLLFFPRLCTMVHIAESRPYFVLGFSAYSFLQHRGPNPVEPVMEHAQPLLEISVQIRPVHVRSLGPRCILQVWKYTRVWVFL